MTTSHDQTVISFAAALANRYQVALDILHPKARIIVTGAFATNDPASYSVQLSQWLTLGDAAANTLPRTQENRNMVRTVADEFLQAVFSFPGHIAKAPPTEFNHTPMGRIWNSARSWAEDDLITLTEAAAMTGLSIAAIGQSKKLNFFLYPYRQKHGSRLVKRSDVAMLYFDKIKEMNDESNT